MRQGFEDGDRRNTYRTNHVPPDRLPTTGAAAFDLAGLCGSTECRQGSADGNVGHAERPAHST
jgi:hypothetical protein